MAASFQGRDRRVSAAVCVATFKRPELLAQLFEALSLLTFRKVAEPEITVVVVDNDPGQSAAETCRKARLPWRLKYAVEPRRGIAQARNRALHEAGSADFIGFLDDDEFPAPGWLDELLAAQASFAADVVCGLVVPRFGADVPAWVKTGKFFERPSRAAGTTPDTFSTNNALVRGAVFASVHGFDERFSLTGGEDTQFFLRVRRAGFSIVFSDAAIVHEPVPASRGNLTWMLRRAYQGGNSWVLCELSLDGRRSIRMLRLLKACTRMAQGACSACLSPLLGWVALVRALRTFCLGAGMLAALAGHRFEPYQQADMDPIGN